MVNPLNTKSGYTLVEVLVSVTILTLILPFIASTFINNKLLASYSKHKIQAAYAAQQIIETERQNAFIVGSQTIPATGTTNVILDTKGNYSSSSCANANTGPFCGTVVITVTPATYTSTSGTAQPASTTVDHFVVTIKWTEENINTPVTMTESYAEDVANDTMLN